MEDGILPDLFRAETMTLPCPLYNAVREIYLAKQSSCEEKTKMLIQRCLFQESLTESWTTPGWLVVLLSAQEGS